MAKRVFQLAKELGIKSKDLIDRCHEQGVPGMDNHMSTVSAGLEASIREWHASGWGDGDGDGDGHGEGGQDRGGDSGSAATAESAERESDGASAATATAASGDDESSADTPAVHAAPRVEGGNGAAKVSASATSPGRARPIRKKAARKKAARRPDREDSSSDRGRDRGGRSAPGPSGRGRIVRRQPTGATSEGEGRSRPGEASPGQDYEREATSSQTGGPGTTEPGSQQPGEDTRSAVGETVTGETTRIEGDAATAKPHHGDDIASAAAATDEAGFTTATDNGAATPAAATDAGPEASEPHGGAQPDEAGSTTEGDSMTPAVAAEAPSADDTTTDALTSATSSDELGGGGVATTDDSTETVDISEVPTAPDQASVRPAATISGETEAADEGAASTTIDESGVGTAARPAADARRPGAEDGDGAGSAAAGAPGRPRPSGTTTRPNVPQRPTAVRPAGPRLADVQRTPAKLSGPKVVRVEQPDVIDRPRPRPRPDRGAPPAGGRGVGGGYAGPPDFGGGGGGGGAGAGGGADGPSRRNTRRKGGPGGGREGRSGKTGRFAGGDRSNRNFNAQDILERQQRLRGSHGFIKNIRRDAKKMSDGPTVRARSARETGGTVKISEPFTIKDLSSATGVRASEILTALFKKGVMTNINSGIDTDMAMEIMLEYDIELDVTEQQTAEDLVAKEFEDREMIDEQSRPPVVTILGHVDHGKTSLLDRIRHANVAEGEAGGITQHTSAFRISVRAGEDDKTIVFLDTPGHEAFTSMRARGAQITDIVVLVVAADDGIMPQTVESINHAKAAGVPIIVALNKIDKPEATDSNLQRIYAQLAEHELSPVEWGGKTEVVKCSALKDVGIQDLLDTIDFQAQLMELTADYGGRARGSVIEGMMVEGRGAVANVLILEGQIKIGDFVVMGRAYGRVRSMRDDRGRDLKEAGPATPLEISGLSAVPDAGDRVYVVENLRMAEQAAEQRVSQERERELAIPKVTLDNIFSQIKGGERKDLNLVVKADVQGSVETLKKTLAEIQNDELNVRVLHAAVGGITESDILLAEASDAIVLGFHVISSAKARELADQKHVEMRTYQVIYELLDDVKKAAEGLLEPELREEVLGHAEVREVFKISKVGWVAGCYVTDGQIQRAAKIRVTRQDIVIENNRVLEQLKRFKDDAREVRAGQECGMKIEGYDDIKPGDILECYKITEIKRTL